MQIKHEIQKKYVLLHFIIISGFTFKKNVFNINKDIKKNTK